MCFARLVRFNRLLCTFVEAVTEISPPSSEAVIILRYTRCWLCVNLWNAPQVLPASETANYSAANCRWRDSHNIFARFIGKKRAKIQPHIFFVQMKSNCAILCPPPSPHFPVNCNSQVLESPRFPVFVFEQCVSGLTAQTVGEEQKEIESGRKGEAALGAGR